MCNTSLISATALARLACQGCVFSVCFLSRLCCSCRFPVGLFTAGLVLPVWYCRCLLLPVCYCRVCLNVVKGPPPLPRRGYDVCPFLVSNFGIVFGMHFCTCFSILAPLRAPFRHRFPLFVHHFFEHRFRIDFSSILGRNLTSFLVFFHDFPAPHTHLAKPRFFTTVWCICH